MKNLTPDEKIMIHHARAMRFIFDSLTKPKTPVEKFDDEVKERVDSYPYREIAEENCEALRP